VKASRSTTARPAAACGSIAVSSIRSSIGRHAKPRRNATAGQSRRLIAHGIGIMTIVFATIPITTSTSERDFWVNSSISIDAVTGQWTAGSTSSVGATGGLAPLLNGRAGHGAVGAIDAAIAGLWLEHGVAGPAFVEPLAGVGGHDLGLGVPAHRAAQRRLQNDGAHFALPATVEG